MGLDEIADELYGLAPGDFVAARRERAAAAKAAGDRELATAVGKLARPTVVAWLANQLVRAEPDEVRTLLELGSALRDAQAAGSGDELRRLSAGRHTLTSALTRRAGQIAAEAGHRLQNDAERALAGTLEAALSDPAAAEAVRAGRLTRALSYAGLGTVEMTTASGAAGRGAASDSASDRDAAWPGDVAQPGDVARPGDVAWPGDVVARGGQARPAKRKRASPKRPSAADEARERRLRVARDELAAAERAVTDARRRATDRESAATAAQNDLDEARRRVDDLTVRLERARRKATKAQAAAQKADRKSTDATAAAQQADERRSAALAALANLGEPADPNAS